ncbi:uncharacterized protein PGRI_067440 [Penicillium griseofulvum]|uniref:Uncharacterized protein n=1 Tax=Penicillium patulum TaxID=5078 RepID=A0A135LQF3_PENPA|nr:uncharacterized protein PGRI_067440 [Penicillium griseofulvum]KXG51172.1 hypothetical protein PGRI_067440 [Penicillium griseofulvum]
MDSKKKARRGGEKRDMSSNKKPARNTIPPSLPPRPPTPGSSAEASGPAAQLNTTTTTEGSPGVDQPGLLSRLGQFSQSEAVFLVQALKEFRERNTREDFPEEPLIKDDPDQEESTYGFCVESDEEVKGDE